MGKVVDVRVTQNGQMVLPRAIREALGMADGGTVVLSVEGDEVKLTSVCHSIKRAQDLNRQHARADATVDGFLADRRAEADREH